MQLNTLLVGAKGAAKAIGTKFKVYGGVQVGAPECRVVEWSQAPVMTSVGRRSACLR
jgi:hypothetical protein